MTRWQRTLSEADLTDGVPYGPARQRVARLLLRLVSRVNSEYELYLM